MFKKILLILAAVVVVLLVVIAMRPADFSVSRSATVNAPPAAVFAQVNDFRKWEAWSPWLKMDPNTKVTFEGPAEGKGAKYAWVSEKTGEGNMTILESQPNERILIDLIFVKPFAADNDVEFTFKPEGDGTAVTWTMMGKNNFMGKAFGLFMDVEKMVGSDFEKGLADIKTAAEAPAPPPN
jgi:uncharacterized protein YndB with AHSA1/START domain